MELSTILMVAQTVSEALSMPGKIKSAKRVAGYQKQMAETAYKYNKKQIQDAYGKAYKQSLSNYALELNGITAERENVQSQLNVMASQQGVNLASSSVEGDMERQLDFEFNKGLQDLETSNINQLSNLVSGMTAQQIGLDQSYSNQIATIGKAVDLVEQKSTEDLFSSMLQLGTKGFEDYSDFTSRKESNTLGDWFTSFNFGGGK